MKREGNCEHLWKFSGEIFGRLFGRDTPIEMECELCGIRGLKEAGQLWQKDCNWHDLGQDLGMIEMRYQAGREGLGE